MEKYLLLFFVLFVFTNCNTDSSAHTAEVEKIMNEYAKVNTCRLENEGFTEMSNRLKEATGGPLAAVEEVQFLKKLYYACDKRGNAEKTPDAKANVFCPNIFMFARVPILDRLGAMKNKAAAEVLIGFYKDESLRFDGSYSNNLGHAMTQCGQEILPLLDPVKNMRGGMGPRVINAIKKGDNYY